jgi:hypothetical protein
MQMTPQPTNFWTMAACLGALTLAASAAEFHVAPNGSDANPGTMAKPFATVERARDAMRGQGGGEVVVHGGTYVLQNTIELTPLDSGAKGRPVRYRAAEGETPVFTSARAITGWKKYTEANLVVPESAKGHLWFAAVPKGWRFHTLYVNGEAQQVSRAPNSDVKRWRSWPRAQPGRLWSPGARAFSARRSWGLRRPRPPCPRASRSGKSAAPTCSTSSSKAVRASAISSGFGF